MQNYHRFFYGQNKGNLQYTKKESVFDNPYLLKDKASAFLRGARIKTTNPSSLVYISNIKKMIYRKIEWSRHHKINKLFYIFAYAEEHNFYAINLRFSYEFIDKLKCDNNPADFIRRRVNANFKYLLGYIPQYAFIVEEDKKHNIHLHGVMEIDNHNKVKHILKRTCFGMDYKNSNMNKYILKYEPLYNSGRWCAYCLKGKFAKNKQITFYSNRALTSAVSEQYKKIREFN